MAGSVEGSGLKLNLTPTSVPVFKLNKAWNPVVSGIFENGCGRRIAYNTGRIREEEIHRAEDRAALHLRLCGRPQEVVQAAAAAVDPIVEVGEDWLDVDDLGDPGDERCGGHVGVERAGDVRDAGRRGVRMRRGETIREHDGVAAGGEGGGDGLGERAGAAGDQDERHGEPWRAQHPPVCQQC